jgi:ubiquinone/menaquinone biosynthesis C-methylase UbiE
MPDRQSPEASPPSAAAGSSADARSSVISSVKTVLGFLVLVVLIAEGALLAAFTADSTHAAYYFTTMVVLLAGLVLLVVVVGIRWPAVLGSSSGPVMGPELDTAGTKAVDTRVIEKRLETSPGIVGEEAPPPSANVWYEELRPVLHQAIHYTSPTYFLDVNLKMVDWNLAFELVFSRSLGRIRGRHVKHFIVELANYDEVIAHAQEFTKKVLKGKIPFVDVEPLRYGSEKYGDVSFLKVAAQLHDPQGRPRGWSVSLLIREIDWDAFSRDLLEESRKDKLWSVYSASYDRVLLEFPPNKKLIEDVIAVVPPGRQTVVDLGAGTGNVTAALLAAGHSVTAVESNLAMLDRLRSKKMGGKALTVVKASVENLDGLADASFDAAVMVNVLYAVSDPLTCLQGVSRILKPRGVLGLSTTHAETDLDPLLGSIKARLEETGKYHELASDYQLLKDLNKAIEKEIARRHTRDDYRQWVQAAGFEIIRDVPSTYEDAVMLIHARKT